jgi:hypothetical protein
MLDFGVRKAEAESQEVDRSNAKYHEKRAKKFMERRKNASSGE